LLAAKNASALILFEKRVLFNQELHQLRLES